MLYATGNTYHVERCHVKGLVHSGPNLDGVVEESDVVTAAVDFTPKGLLLFIQLNRSLNLLSQDSVQKSR